MNRMAGVVLLAALSITALAMAAATFDSIAPSAPGAADPGGLDADVIQDGSGGSPLGPDGSDSSDSLGGLATPFEWRVGLADDGAGMGDGGLVVPLALAGLAVFAIGVVALLTGSGPAADPDRSGPEDAAVANDAPERPRWTVEAGENAVYRSWRRLADRLDAPPDWSPADLAAAARNRGFDGRVVAELTTTFCEVRYGGLPATREREERATDALDRLEMEDDA